MSEEISRRVFLSRMAGGVVVTGAPFILSGCVAGKVIIRVAPTIRKVISAGLSLADGFLTITGLIKELEQLLIDAPMSAPEIVSLRKGARLFIIDGAGREIPVKDYGVFEWFGTVQNCYGNEVPALYTHPTDERQAIPIRQLTEGERVGVFDLQYSSVGCYHVKTLADNKTGWIHGNCLERMPRKKS